jgi:heme-degrading monooxygenase HmoA
MIIRRVLLLTTVLALGATISMTNKPATAKDNEASAAGKRLRHVVLFKFKDDVQPAQVQEVIEAFRELPKQIDTIEGFEWGTNVSPENKAAGFTHCFFLTFRDDKGRDVYLPHAAHKAFGKIVGPKLDKVLVVDYWTEK